MEEQSDHLVFKNDKKIKVFTNAWNIVNDECAIAEIIKILNLKTRVI